MSFWKNTILGFEDAGTEESSKEDTNEIKSSKGKTREGKPQHYNYKSNTEEDGEYYSNFEVKQDSTAFSYYLLAFKKYAVFTGRASRAEYWYFFLFFNIIYCLLLFIDGIIGTYDPTSARGLVSGLFLLTMLIPFIAVCVRRMHDTNKSGWFVLFPIYNFVLSVTNGTRGNNKYGSDPKLRVLKKVSIKEKKIKRNMIFCKQCGKQNSEESNFCRNCGEKIN